MPINIIDNHPSHQSEIMSALSILESKATAVHALPKPKRPLSSFNMFYRFKRQKVIGLDKASKDDITALVEAAPGLENCYPPAPQDASPQEINKLRKQNIRKDMENNLEPRDTKSRRHRIDQSAMNGGMSFLELGKLMNRSWQSCDDFAKSVFTELADEGRELYKQRMKKYNASRAILAEEEHRAKVVHDASNTMRLPTSDTSTIKNKLEYINVTNEMAEAKRRYEHMYNTFKNNSNQYHNDESPRSIVSTRYAPSPAAAQHRLYSVQPPSPPSPGFQRLVSNDEGDLRVNVQRLEEQLNAARNRVHAMEASIEIEHRLRMEDQARAGMQAAAQQHQQRTMRQDSDPLSCLASASMMHSAMLSRNALMHIMMDDTRTDNPITYQEGNKKQRRR